MTSTAPTIEDLPNEVLVPILQQIPYRDRNSAYAVSVRWRCVADETIGRKLFVGKPCPYTPTDESHNGHKYVPIEKISEIGVNVCHVGEVIDPLQDETRFQSFWRNIREFFISKECPTFKYPYLVRRVFFDGPIPSRFFQSMILPLCNLSRLDIHHSALSCLEPSIVQNLPFTKLETLNIWGQNAFHVRMASHDRTVALRAQETLQLLLEKNYFDSLKNFAIEYPFDIPQDILLTKSILSFLRRHRKTIERLKIEVDIYSLTDEEIDTQTDREVYENARNTSKVMLKLRNIELTVTSVFNVRHLQVWVQLVKQQKTLEKFSLSAMRVPSDFILHVCSNNAHTLKSIWISRLLLVHNNELTLFHCSVFEMCSKLQSLILESIIVIINAALLNDCSLLPKSLRVIEFTGMTISNEDVSVIALEMPALEELLLSDIGTDGNLGMTLSVMEQVIRRKQFKTFQLCDGLNGRFPPKGISNCHPSRPVYLQPTVPGYFDFKKDDEGYYITEENLINAIRARNPTF